ncbi:MAG: Gfo/Idh/MocA family oxidoreductase [Clostridia bacterium]|nr:Gfo/Idh/MocA family oxidoreductase [Clostridia bacterium]
MTFGIIGTNFISSNFIAALPYTSAGVSAVYSRREETGKAFAEKHNLPFVYTDMDAFLASDIDAVYIASPNFLHKEQAIRALKAGKHVLVEKPAAPSLAEWQEMKEEAKKAGKVLMEAMRPIHAEAWEIVKNNLQKIGKVREAVLDYCQYSSRYDAFLEGTVLNAFNPALSNAALLDIGIYPISAAVFTFGMPKDIKSRSCFLPNGFECGGTVILGYEGFSVTVTYSKVAQSVTPSHIIGEKGGIVIDKVSNPLAVTLYTENGAKKEPIPLPQTDAMDNMFEEVRDFCQAIEDGDLLPAALYTDMSLSVMDAVRAENGITFPSDEKEKKE